MKKVSFDWDSTLDRIPVQKFAKELIDDGYEVWILTSRYDNEHLVTVYNMDEKYADMTNEDLFECASILGIPEERIIFTNLVDKYHFLKDKDFLFHLDDDWVENNRINKHTKCVGISSINPNWKQKCLRVLNKNS